MKPETFSEFISFPVPTAFYPGSGDDLSYLRRLLDAGVRIFIHSDIFPNPEISREIYCGYLSKVNTQLIDNGYNPELLVVGNLMEELIDFPFRSPIYENDWDTALIFGEWHLIHCMDPLTRDSFVILMMNTDANLALRYMFESQNPNYITFGRVSGIDVEPCNPLYKTLRTTALHHGVPMPVIYPPLNRWDIDIWEGYEYAYENGTWVPNPAILGGPENQAQETENTAQFPISSETKEIIANLIMKMIQALNIEATLPWNRNAVHIPMPLPALTQAELRQNNNLFDTNRIAFYSRRHNQEITSVMFRMTENKGGGLYAVERWCEQATQVIICEESFEDGAASGCGRYYLPTTQLIGEEYWISGAVYETRVVNCNPILTTHTAQPGIIQNLEQHLNALIREIETMEEAALFKNNMQEFLNLTNELRIQVFPLTHHYKHGLRRNIEGFSAVVQFIRPDGSRIAEVSYLNERVSGCVRMYDESNNLTGEIYVNMGKIVRYNRFLLPT